MNLLESAIRILVIIFISLFVSISFILLIHRIIAQKIKREHKIRETKGIDEELTLPLGGINQYIYIRGFDISNPLILFLHGGPGGAATGALHKYQYLWEKEYTVVNWDQRISGKTFYFNKTEAKKISAQLNLDILIEDLYELVSYLLHRFGKEKIILMGHSWGSVLGNQFIEKYPKIVEAYIGVGQTINLIGGLLKMASLIRSFAENQENKIDLIKINNLVENIKNSKTIPNAEALELYKIAQKYMPINLDTSVYTKALLTSPYCHLYELGYYAKMELLNQPLIHYLLNYNLNASQANYTIPIIYIFGSQDWASRLIAEDYFSRISAPYKKYIIIEKAGHTTMLDQPEIFFKEFSQALGNSKN